MRTEEIEKLQAENQNLKDKLAQDWMVFDNMRYFGLTFPEAVRRAREAWLLVGPPGNRPGWLGRAHDLG